MQHRTALIIFPLVLQTVIITHMLSIGGEGRGGEETGRGEQTRDRRTDRRVAVRSVALRGKTGGHTIN